jgi:hypothetical protein
MLTSRQRNARIKQILRDNGAIVHSVRFSPGGWLYIDADGDFDANKVEVQLLAEQLCAGGETDFGCDIDTYTANVTWCASPYK